MRLLTLLLTTLALALAACGGDDGEEPATTTETPAADTAEEPTAAGGELTLAADEQQLAFDKDTLTAEAGSVTIAMENPASIPHNVGIKGGDINEVGEVVNKGGTSKVTVDLEPGTYTFYCSVAGHEAAGMKGTLTVE